MRLEFVFFIPRGLTATKSFLKDAVVSPSVRNDSLALGRAPPTRLLAVGDHARATSETLLKIILFAY